MVFIKSIYYKNYKIEHNFNKGYSVLFYGEKFNFNTVNEAKTFIDTSAYK